jgi:hypothetical protein
MSPTPTSEPTEPAAAPSKPTRAAKAAEETAPAPESTPVDAATDAAPDPATGPATEETPADGEPEKRRRGRPKGSTAKTTRTIELTLTVSGTVDGDWQAELKQGSTWLSRGLPVSSTAVSRAVRELHPELAEPIDAAIGVAREQRASRVAALEAELEQARKALAALDGRWVGGGAPVHADPDLRPAHRGGRSRVALRRRHGDPARTRAASRRVDRRAGRRPAVHR